MWNPPVQTLLVDLRDCPPHRKAQHLGGPRGSPYLCGGAMRPVGGRGGFTNIANGQSGRRVSRTLRERSTKYR
jgi:hypothetical protein